MNEKINNILKNAKVNRLGEFLLFAKWLAMSPIFRFLPEENLVRLGLDEEELELLKIKSQTEFSQKFDIGQDRLSDWKKLDELWDLVDIFKKEWGRKKTPSVLAGFYKKTISEADAARVKLWLEYFENFKSSSEVDLNTNLPIQIIVSKKEEDGK